MNTIITSRGDKAARGLSMILQPPLLLLASLFLVVYWQREVGLQLLPSIGCYLTFAVALPLGVFFHRRKVGKITEMDGGFDRDMDIPCRQQRIVPYCWALGGAMAALLMLSLMEPPHIFYRFVMGQGLLTAGLLAVTVLWKISAHSAGCAAAAVVAATILRVPEAMLVTPLVGVVGWARLKRKRHTVAQLVAGAGVGWLVFHLCLSW